MKLTDLPTDVQQEIIEMQELTNLGPSERFHSLDTAFDGDLLYIMRAIKLWIGSAQERLRRKNG